MSLLYISFNLQTETTMVKRKVLLITFMLLRVSLFSQVIMRTGSVEWIEQQGKIYSKKQVAKFTVPEGIVQAKGHELSRNDTVFEVTTTNIKVSLDFFKLGAVEDVNDTLEVRTLEIESANAYFLSLIFSEFTIPEGDELYIYNRKKTILMGPFTSRNSPKGGRYTVDIIEDDNLILEYQKSKHGVTTGKIHISQIVHGMNPLRTADTEPNLLLKQALNYDDCFIDANCSEGDGWSNQKSGVCLVFASKEGTMTFASAVLVNNARQDNTPYILTANHNLSGYNDYSLYTFRFKYWTNACGNRTSTNSATIIYTGAEVLETWNHYAADGNDIALLKLLEEPSSLDSVYLCGWSMDASAPTQGVYLSHTGPIPMEIAKSNNIRPYSMPNYGGFNINAWWYCPIDIGAIATGASGSPLFDEDKRIIGILSANAPLPNNCYSVAFSGRLNYAWSTLGDNGYTLRDWLDPDNTGVITLDGQQSCEMVNFTNQVVTTNTTITGCNIYIKNVTVTNGAKLTIVAKDVDIQQPFDVLPGSELDVNIQ
jgi:hypothetical protein